MFIVNPMDDTYNNTGISWSSYQQSQEESSIQGSEKTYAVEEIQTKTEIDNTTQSVWESAQQEMTAPSWRESFEKADEHTYAVSGGTPEGYGVTSKSHSEESISSESSSSESSLYLYDSIESESSSYSEDSSQSTEWSGSSSEKTSYQPSISYEQRGDAWSGVAEKAVSFIKQFWGSSSKDESQSQETEKEKHATKVTRRTAPQARQMSQNDKYFSNLSDHSAGNSVPLRDEIIVSSIQKEIRLSDHNPTQKVCIIPGGTGHLGREFAEQALKDGYKVIITTRSTKDFDDSENLYFVQANEADQANPEFWKQILSKYSQAESVSLINTMGAPEAPPGKTLRDVNVLPAAAMATAMKELEDKGDLQNAKMVHLSSMGAVMLKGDPYGDSKKESEELVTKYGPRNICVIRVGYAFQRAEKGEITKIDNTHAYGPEQLAVLPIQPVLGSGQQLLQPVFTGDIVDAGMNFKEGVKIVNAVGHEVLTQENFMAYFCELSNKKFRPIHIPIELAAPISESFPKGHFSPYAVELCQRMETEDMVYDAKGFEEVIGHKTSTLNDVYGDLKTKKLYYARPPIMEHSTESIEKFYYNKDNARNNIKKTAYTFGKVVLSKANNRKAIEKALEDL